MNDRKISHLRGWWLAASASVASFAISACATLVAVVYASTVRCYLIVCCIMIITGVLERHHSAQKMCACGAVFVASTIGLRTVDIDGVFGLSVGCAIAALSWAGNLPGSVAIAGFFIGLGGVTPNWPHEISADAQIVNACCMCTVSVVAFLSGRIAIRGCMRE